MTDYPLDAPCYRQSHLFSGEKTTNAFHVTMANSHLALAPKSVPTILLKSFNAYRVQHNQKNAIGFPVLLYAQLTREHSNPTTLPAMALSYDVLNRIEHNLESNLTMLGAYALTPLANRNNPETALPDYVVSMTLQPLIDHNQSNAPDETGDYIQVGRGRRITASKRVIIS